jgi:hypothetical protein
VELHAIGGRRILFCVYSVCTRDAGASAFASRVGTVVSANVMCSTSTNRVSSTITGAGAGAREGVVMAPRMSSGSLTSGMCCGTIASIRMVSLISRVMMAIVAVSPARGVILDSGFQVFAHPNAVPGFVLAVMGAMTISDMIMSSSSRMILNPSF